MSKHKQLPLWRRKYLNPPGHPSTGDVNCFCGDFSDQPDGKDANTFISVSDCHTKVRLHISGTDKQARTDFLHKIYLLEKEARQFRKDLEARWKLKGDTHD